MRRATCLMMLIAAVGCKNQSAPLSNPFLTPDRVPPPSTRVLMPGTAQPYYPGDPVPGAAGTVPPGGYPPLGSPPPTTYGVPQAQPGAVVPGTTYPSGPITPTVPTTPPGGWPTYPAPGGTASTGSPSGVLTASHSSAVAVPSDQQELRFELPTPRPSLAADAAPTTQPLVAVPTQQPTLPIQSMLSLNQSPAGAFPPNAGAQGPVSQAAFGQPAMPQLATREVTQAEYLQGRSMAAAPVSAAPASASIGPDGFRPQGTSPETPAEDPSSPFRRPEIRRDAVGTASTASTASADGRFAVGPQQESLRGQLEYWPETGEWSIKYMSDEGPTDQIGGRVLIDNPQVLGNLPPGEFVVVRGQLYGRQIDEASYRPAYRVATVERQRQ